VTVNDAKPPLAAPDGITALRRIPEDRQKISPETYNSLKGPRCATAQPETGKTMTEPSTYNAVTLSELRRWYHLPEEFPGKLPVTKKAIWVCNSHSPCVGRGDDLIFRYADGSSDTGHEGTICRCEFGNRLFQWSEDKACSAQETKE